jgi:hypothetical protein
LQERGDEAVGLREQGGQQMFGADFLVGMAARHFLRSLERFLCFDGQLFRIHVEKLCPECQPVKRASGCQFTILIVLLILLLISSDVKRLGLGLRLRL